MSNRETIDAFHLLWYERQQRKTWRNTYWRGVPSQQCPTDLWVYQELIQQHRPETFIEVGLKRGGTTLYLANLLDLLHGDDIDAGRVIGVDITIDVEQPVRDHPRIELIEGSSIDDSVFSRVQLSTKGPTMVLLDSNHTRDHVLRELELYSTLVSPGMHVIVNDTNINGHPALEGWGPGPQEAVVDFLAGAPEFTVDADCEKHMLTQSPGGFLRRSAVS